MYDEDDVLILWKTKSRSFWWQVEIIQSCRLDRGVVKQYKRREVYK